MSAKRGKKHTDFQFVMDIRSSLSLICLDQESWLRIRPPDAIMCVGIPVQYVGLRDVCLGLWLSLKVYTAKHWDVFCTWCVLSTSIHMHACESEKMHREEEYLRWWGRYIPVSITCQLWDINVPAGQFCFSRYHLYQLVMSGWKLRTFRMRLSPNTC